MKTWHGFLLLVVFVSGMTVMAIEMAASRLLAPYFGTSIFIWANLIGLIMIYLTAGYYLGGRLADRYPHDAVLYRLTAWAAFLIGVIPIASRPILRWSMEGLAALSAGSFYGSLVGVIFIFAAPIIMLGCVSPFAIRLAMSRVEKAGNIAGSIYALSTVGSILGTFFPVLLMIPNIGTAKTIYAFSLVLLTVSLVGLALGGVRRAARYAALLVVVATLAILTSSGLIKPSTDGTLLAEAETPYNYIQVVQKGDQVNLELNEGLAIHSIYNPKTLLTGGPWDYFLLAPFFNRDYRESDVHSLAVIGLGAGTVPKQYSAVFGPQVAIDGIELDPKIIALGRQYFSMNEPNLHAIAQDGRYFLETTDRKYDVIAIDAYRQPYIPFHLTTREFFQEVRRHLTSYGVTVINCGRTTTDFRLVDVIASTMKDVFPNVYVVDTKSFSNSMVIATTQPTQIANFAENVGDMQNQTLLQVANDALQTGHIREITRSDVVFTDDHAPVEQVIDQMIFSFVAGESGKN